MLVYGLGVYCGENGYSGVNVFHLYKTIPEICEHIDHYISDNVSDKFIEKKMSLEEIKEDLDRRDHAVYKILEFEDGMIFVYEVVSLVLH